MLKRDITIGNVYRVKVSGQLTDVRVDRTGNVPRHNRVQRFWGTNLRTNREVSFTAAKCRREVNTSL
jgi:hypothetical protein